MGLLRADAIGNPLSWRVADRCLAIGLLLLVANAVMLVSVLAGGWPFLPYPASQAPSLPYGIAFCELGWLAITLRAWQVRRRERLGAEPIPARVLAIATVGWYAMTLAGFTVVTGPFAAPGWMGMLGGAVIGYVLFPRWLALAGLALYLVLTVGLALIHAARLWPALDTLAPPTVLLAMDHVEIVRAAVASLVLSALTFSIIAWVVDRWRDREARYERLASIDALTGLTNRRRFVELAERELARARRYDAEVALVLIDLDHFKLVNDQHGHVAGDAVLANTAAVLARELRDLDVIARHGGEEFAILLPQTSAAGAIEVAERARRRLADTVVVVAGADIRITASMGVAAIRGPGATSLDELLRRADAALYRAKEHGRDRVEAAAAA
ncbi:MAG: GGDEF domain-containing protein [Deltaproteobacteria bacterium]|nr:GGDEF domain-containing protein [Deltaproteobacteria bacterium]